MAAAIDTAPSEQTAAEYVRSVLARAVSLSLSTDGQDYDLIGMHSVDAEGGVTLQSQPGCPLAAQVAAAPDGGLPARMEFTDIAPTALRDRVRAQVTVSGRLVTGRPEHGDGLRFDAEQVTLRTVTGCHDVDVADLTRARPDPLAVEEAALLTHLADAHEDMVAALAALAGSRLPRGVVRVMPLAVDRYGIALRCEYREGHCDVRLLFPVVARDAAEAGERVRLLLTASGCAHHPHPSARR
ncbi:DUF2470 domain-containing protein [Streptomyces sp. NPDC085995]|uniref:DUF2470 domain-containing protein n=1 Tax=Streptomyces sp. NPDC085995 TaxID=3154861 RepID=UPI0034150D00